MQVCHTELAVTRHRDSSGDEESASISQRRPGLSAAGTEAEVKSGKDKPQEQLYMMSGALVPPPEELNFDDNDGW